MNQIVQIQNGKYHNGNSPEQGRELVAIKNHFEDLQSRGYQLYGISITYKARSGHSHSVDIINKNFKALYLHNFLPGHYFKLKRWTKNQKEFQPYVYTFIEPHVKTPMEFVPSSGIYAERDFPQRYHHHAMIAVPNEYAVVMESFLGEDTLIGMHESVKTSVITHADIDWIDYIGKEFSKHRDHWLVFGPPCDSSNSARTH